MAAGSAVPGSGRLRAAAMTFANAMGATVAALGLQLVAFAITARGLGVEQFGRYTGVLAIAAIAVDIAGLGAADVMVRAVATARQQFAVAWGHVLAVTAASWPLVALAGAAVGHHLLQLEIGWGWLLLALLGEIGVSRVQASVELVMVAHEHAARASWVRLAVVGTRLAVAAGYFIVAGRSSLDGWIVVTAAQSALMVTLLLLVTARLYGRPAWRGGYDFRAGGWFCLTQVTRSLQTNVDRIVLARVGSDAVLGAYGAASRIAQLGVFPIQIGTRMLYPKFFERGRAGVAAMRRFALRAAAIMGAIGVAAGLAVAAAGWLAVPILGPEYAASAPLARIIALAFPFIALQYPAADTLTGLGLQPLRATLALVSTAAFVVLLAGAAIGWGADGVAWGFVAGHVAIAVLLWTVAWRRTGRPAAAPVTP